MITVHHLDHSRSHRVLWLLEELGLEYELRRYERDPETLRAPPALKAIHPLGKAPTVVDDGRVLAESGAVLETLLARHGGGRLAPAMGTPERERYTYWMHYAEGSAMPAMVLRLLFSRMPRQPMPALARPVVRVLAKNVIDTFVQPQIDQHLDFMEGELARSTWFAGDEFTAADIQLSFPIETAAAGRVLDARRSKLAAYLDRIHERPAYRRALERGGPYDLSTFG
jgi:glutathione S-transferase